MGRESNQCRLNDDELEDLEDALDTIKANYVSTTHRGAGPAASTPGYGELTVAEIEASAEDIKDVARRGLDLAPYAESRPLRPLFASAATPLPNDVKVDIEESRYDFYVVELTFSIALEPGLGAKRARFEVKFSDDIVDPARGVRPIRLFPGKKDIELFKTDVTGSVGIDASASLTVPKEVNRITPYIELSASASAKAKAGIVVGPYEFSFRRAALQVTGESNPHVMWSYELESELSAKNDFKSILILKVAREATKVDAQVELSVTPYKRSWFLFEKALPILKLGRRLPIELVTAPE